MRAGSPSSGSIAENFNPFSPTALQPARGIIYEPLYYYNLMSSGDPKPMLATGYSWNADGTKLTVTTRQGVKWSDGKPFSAADVAFTFNMIAKTASINTNGLAATAAVKDDHTVVLSFKKTSFVSGPSVLGDTAIVPEHLWKDKNPATDINRNPVGTGAYSVATFTPQSYELKRNPGYWQQGKPQIDKVRYISLASADAATSALLAGEVDWMSAYFPGFDGLMKGKKELSYVNTPALTTSLFACSSAKLGCKGPQTDVAVRQAIYAALDRDQLNKLAFSNVANPGSPTLLIPGRDDKWISPSVEAKTPQGADTGKAESVLTKGGWSKGPDGIYVKDGQRLSLTIQVVTGWSDFISAIDAMTQQLRKAGMEIKSSQMSWNEWNSRELKGTYQLSLNSIGLGPSTDPYYTYEGKYSSKNTAPAGQNASSNPARYANPAVDAAIAAAAQTNDEAAKLQQYAVIQDNIARDLPYIPMVIGSTLTEFNNSRATGWPTQDNLYSFPASWKAWDNGVVLQNLTPVK
ncbi:ABC transporter substrate-binding protein [Kribbella catacumbae]|uniref:ABC transporter substrate-binding protein n=1 Tax=Kribbella catacumbae TaxID=460086 RepID=UPI00036345A1|nr:ABC transporter substrate-binding protein [Kribbella catacumbae]